MTDLRAGKESQGTSGDSSRTSGSLLRRLGRKMTKDRLALSKQATLHGFTHHSNKLASVSDRNSGIGLSASHQAQQLFAGPTQPVEVGPL